MTPERWKKIEDIFQDALDCAPAGREQFIQKKCGGDEELQLEVKKLIARFEAADTFLESPVWTDSGVLQPSLKQQIAASLEEEIFPGETAESFIGRQIGVFRLVEELGRGGMGIVYLAERADGEFRQRVAIKLIKRGMDTDFIVRRFRHERQILANLNHPNIGRLLDGGTTSDDLPYFVMEFIEGKPFFKYCEANNLNLRQKLELFLAVCSAIGYAHKRKIIHRDIKPSNILVTDEDVPKLLDFGIAKILDPDLIHESISPTATQMRLMTPEYASPEQVRGEEITPASDQYSLGVLLYELITGARPYKFPSRAPHEIARIICEEEPLELSSGEFGRLITEDKSLLNDSETGQKLDRIVLKTLRKEAGERYASVTDLAADIERFLRNETLLAKYFTGDYLEITPEDASHKSIAVLPFKLLNNVSDEDINNSGEFLAVGLADALITRLSSVRQLIVRPTNSVLKLRESNPESFSVGIELGVGFVVDGSILYVNKRLRVSAQLLDVKTRSIMWGERFDVDFTDVLSLEDEISEKVAESLVPHLTGEERRQLEKRGTNNIEAFEAYLRGRFHWNTFTDEGFRQAIYFYKKAIEIDPNYALAYAGIADYYVMLGIYNVLPVSEFYLPAKEAARRAIEIDDKLSEAFAALSLTELYGEYNWDASEKNMQHAIELNPNNSLAHLWYSHSLYTQKRFAEGTKHIELAIEIDPLSFQNHNTLAWSYYFKRQTDNALKEIETVINEFPTISHGYFGKACFLNFIGKSGEGLKDMNRALELSKESMFAVYGMAQTLGAAGKRREAEELIEKTKTHQGKEYFSYYQIAQVYCYLKDKNKAFDFLEQSFRERESLLVWLAIEPSLDILRDDARYFALLKRLNHPLASAADFVPDSIKPNEIKSLQKAEKEEARAISPENLKLRFPEFLKYVLAAVLLAIITFFAYQFFSHLTFDFSTDAPIPGSLQNTFASKMSIRRFTSTGKEVLATISPDGSQVAYVSAVNEQQTLRLRQTEGTESREIVPAAAVVYLGVTFAPDEKSLYYTAVDTGYTFRAIYRVSLESSGDPQKIIDQPTSAAGFAPDGKRFAYYGLNTQKSAAVSLYIAGINDKEAMSAPAEAVTLQHPEYFLGNPVFSPDGKKIAYMANLVVDERHFTKIFVYDVENKAAEKFETSEFFDVNGAVWLNNGSEIVISASKNSGSPHQIWLINYPSGKTTRLTNDLNDYSSVSVDKNLTTVVAARGETNSDIWLSNLGAANDGGNLKQLTQGINRQDGIKGMKWATNEKIFYVADDETESGIKSMNTDGSGLQSINIGDVLPSEPLISSDNRFLFYINNKEPEASIWRYELGGGGNLIRITNRFTFTPTLTPDNRFIIYAAENDHHQLLLHRISTEGGEAAKITAPLSVRPAVSPDNRFIACYLRNKDTQGKWGIAIFRIEGGNPLRLIDLPDTIDLLGPLQRPLVWSADSRALFYLNDKGGVSNIFRIAADGSGVSTQMTKFSSGRIFNFSISPAGNRAVLARGASSSDIVVFKNFK